MPTWIIGDFFIGRTSSTHKNENYRQISKLAFLSKQIERVVALQIVDHMQVIGLTDKFQLLYNIDHSIESVLYLGYRMAAR